jgi:hypothetical protein
MKILNYSLTLHCCAKFSFAIFLTKLLKYIKYVDLHPISTIYNF